MALVDTPGLSGMVMKTIIYHYSPADTPCNTFHFLDIEFNGLVATIIMVCIPVHRLTSEAAINSRGMEFSSGGCYIEPLKLNW